MLKVIDHPLIKHKLTVMRKKETGTKDFRQNLDEIGELMVYEITRDLPLKPIEIETPICQYTGYELAKKSRDCANFTCWTRYGKWNSGFDSNRKDCACWYVS